MCGERCSHNAGTRDGLKKRGVEVGGQAYLCLEPFELYPGFLYECIKVCAMLEVVHGFKGAVEVCKNACVGITGVRRL